jgi:hypothetical protein
MAAVPEFQDDIDPLLRRHLRVFAGIRFISFLEAVEYPDPFLHD